MFKKFDGTVVDEVIQYEDFVKMELPDYFATGDPDRNLVPIH